MSSDLRALAADRIRRRRNFTAHLVFHIVGTVFVAIVWAVTEYHNAGGWPTGFRTGRENHDWDPWIIYPVLAGTMAVVLHGWIAFGRQPVTEYEIDRAIERVGGAR